MVKLHCKSPPPIAHQLVSISVVSLVNESFKGINILSEQTVLNNFH